MGRKEEGVSLFHCIIKPESHLAVLFPAHTQSTQRSHQRSVDSTNLHDLYFGLGVSRGSSSGCSNGSSFTSSNAATLSVIVNEDVLHAMYQFQGGVNTEERLKHENQRVL